MQTGTRGLASARGSLADERCTRLVLGAGAGKGAARAARAPGRCAVRDLDQPEHGDGGRRHVRAQSRGARHDVDEHAQEGDDGDHVDGDGECECHGLPFGGVLD
jgi:hypothetical protein